MALEIGEILESGDASVYELHTNAAGPSGALPLTEEMLRNWASGDLFGLSQDARPVQGTVKLAAELGMLRRVRLREISWDYWHRESDAVETDVDVDCGYVVSADRSLT